MEDPNNNNYDHQRILGHLLLFSFRTSTTAAVAATKKWHRLAIFGVVGCFAVWMLFHLAAHPISVTPAFGTAVPLDCCRAASGLVGGWPRRAEEEDDVVEEENRLLSSNSTAAGGATLVLYVYFEKDELYKENLETFLEVGVDERHDVDFLFIVQGRSSVSFPSYGNVRVLRKSNQCLDFGGWRYGLDAIPWRSGKYTHFIFINSSVRGPFVPLYVPKAIHWTVLFTSLLQEEGDGYAANGPIKLVGMTINCHQNRPHVQSMLWAIDLETLEYLVDETHVLTCKRTMKEAIDLGEIALSSKVLARGWNIGSLAVAYRGWDFRRQRTCNANRDPNWEGWYYGISPGVHETLFVKTNRGFRPREVEVYTRIARQQAQKGQFNGARFYLKSERSRTQDSSFLFA